MNKQTEALKCEVCDGLGKILYANNDATYDVRPCKACKEALEQPAQEPVGIIYQDMDTLRPAFRFTRPFEYKATTALNPDVPLYTHPCVLTHSAPSWQGLSDDEVEDILLNYAHDRQGFARAIEQLLKEKNT